MIYYGIVENIYDPKKLGRVQVRVLGVHDANKEAIPTEALPWSLVSGPTTSPGISGVGHSSFLLQGAWVVGVFLDKDSQDFLVLGSLPTESGVEFGNTEFGFTDPNGQYPRNTSEEDNNLRARGRPDPNDYEVQGVYQPRSSYAPQYPYNHVYESESGHLKEYDDTPGAARIRERHNSGTYYEVQPGGSKIERVVADNYELILGDDTIEVKGNVNIIVSEDVNLSCAGNVTANVGKNVDFLVNGDVNGEVRGNIAMRVGANLEGHTTIEDGITIHHPTGPGYSKDEAITYFSKDLDVYAEGGYLEGQGIPFNIDELILEDGLWKYGGNTLPARNGHIDLHIEGTVTGLIDGDANLTVLQDVNAIVKGTTTLDCPTTHITGDVRIDGDLSVGKDVKCENGDAGSKVSLYSHNHPGDGGGGLAAHAASTSSPNADD